MKKGSDVDETNFQHQAWDQQSQDQGQVIQD